MQEPSFMALQRTHIGRVELADLTTIDQIRQIRPMACGFSVLEVISSS